MVEEVLLVLRIGKSRCAPFGKLSSRWYGHMILGEIPELVQSHWAYSRSLELVLISVWIMLSRYCAVEAITNRKSFLKCRCRSVSHDQGDA